MSDDKKPVIQTRMDRVIGWFNPQRAHARVKARMRTEMILSSRKYDAAGIGRRKDGWIRPSSSANTENRGAIIDLRNGSRDLTRNNPWAKKAIGVISTQTVGSGIRPEFHGKERQDSESVKGYAEGWARWANTTECDYDGLKNWAGIQEQIMRSVPQDGEALIRKRLLTSAQQRSKKLTIPLQLQVLEADFLDSFKDGVIDGNRVIQGVEFDNRGNRVAYWLHENHPGDNGGGVLNLPTISQSKRIPADEIIHVFKQDRPGQVRGIPWPHAVMMTLKDLDDANDAYLWRQKIAACYVAFILDSDPDAPTNKDSTLPDSLEPGLLEALGPGKSVEFATPPGVDGFHEFHVDQLHSIATGYGISYESLTTDLKGVSFLSGRMGQLDMMKNVNAWQQNMMIPQFCQAVLKWFEVSADLTLFSNTGNELFAEWIVPAREMLDPQKENDVLIDKVRAGMPLFDYLQQIGYKNPEAALRRKAKENTLLDELEVIVDTDPRKVSGTGNSIPPDQQDNETDTGEGDEKDN